MKKVESYISYFEIENRSFLSEMDRQLLERAEEAYTMAYAPYSSFHVGAAVRMEHGEIFIGNNQENASFPAGICAERAAIFSAKCILPEVKIDTICITHTGGKNPAADSPITPCGICRQVMAEYEFAQQSPFRIILASTRGKLFLIEGIKNLLPMAFFPSHII